MTDGRPPERLIDAKEAARLLGLGERTVRRRIASGELVSIKAGTRRLVPLSAIEMAQRRATGGMPDTVPRGMPPAVPTEQAAWLTLIEKLGVLEREVGRLSAQLEQARAEPEKPRALPGDEPGADAPLFPWPPTRAVRLLLVALMVSEVLTTILSATLADLGPVFAWTSLGRISLIMGIVGFYVTMGGLIEKAIRGRPR